MISFAGIRSSTQYTYSNETYSSAAAVWIRTTRALNACGKAAAVGEVYYDALGRETKTRLAEEATSVYTERQYDAMGRLWRVANPYRTTVCVLDDDAVRRTEPGEVGHDVRRHGNHDSVFGQSDHGDRSGGEAAEVAMPASMTRTSAAASPPAVDEHAERGDEEVLL